MQPLGRNRQRRCAASNVLNIAVAWRNARETGIVHLAMNTKGVPSDETAVLRARARGETTADTSFEQLTQAIPDFRRAYDVDGMTVEEFGTFGATVRTLRGFIASYWDLVRSIDEIILPNPDVR